MQKPQIGDRIRLDYMPDDPDPIPAGATGTVLGVSGWAGSDFTVMVAWDCKRSLSLACPPDLFTILESGTSTREE